MPGNAGGAKGPDFWCAFEDGEVMVIGDEPENTVYDRRFRESCVERRRRDTTVQTSLAAVLLSVCLTVKPVGEPDAGSGTSGSMSGDGKRSVAAWLKLPRPSSTLPKLPIWNVRSCVANGGKADNICSF